MYKLEFRDEAIKSVILILYDINHHISLKMLLTLFSKTQINLPNIVSNHNIMFLSRIIDALSTYIFILNKIEKAMPMK